MVVDFQALFVVLSSACLLVGPFSLPLGITVMLPFVNHRGDNNVFNRGVLRSNTIDSSFFLSLSSSDGDLCLPPEQSCGVTSLDFNNAGKAAVQPRQWCSIDDLPDECLFEIFKRLAGPQERSNSSCVSKRWLLLLNYIRAFRILRKFGSNESDSRDEDEGHIHCGLLKRSLGAEASDIGIGKLLIRGSNFPSSGMTDVGLTAIARSCPALRVLGMWSVPSVTDAGLSEIADGCPLLERLHLCGCPLISDKGLISVARKCPNFKSITIESCPKIGNEGLKAVGRYCRKLDSISIKGCGLVGDKGIASLAYFASSTLKNIKLEGLNISDFDIASIGYYGRVVVDLVLSSLHNVNERGFSFMGSARGMHNLNSLSMTSCGGVTDQGLEAIANGSPNLKQLCLRACFNLSDAGMKAFVDASGALEILELEECNRITLMGALYSLLSSNVKLQKLALIKCSEIKDIGEVFSQIPLCMSLRSLTIRDCPGFTSHGLAFVFKICPHLQEIDLRGLVVGVTDAALLSLISSRPPSTLRKLNLSGCAQLTNTAMVALVEAHGKSLELLHFGSCHNITDISLLAISEYCHVLVDLDASRSAITDYGVANLASVRRLNLQVLSLAGCSRVTKKSLPFLRNMGSSLINLNLQNCELIGDYGIVLLGRKIWRCDIHF